jgi:hypothetical protein
VIIKGEILLLSSVSHQGESKKSSEKKKETPVVYFRQERIITKDIKIAPTLEEHADDEENSEETKRYWIPIISANSYKNGCLRRSVGQYLMDALEMKVSDLTPNVVQIVFSGGPIVPQGKSVNYEDPDKGGEKGFKEKLRRMLPHTSLFGASLTTATMLTGRFIYFSKLYPFCEETIDVIGHKPLYSDRPAKEYIDYEYYTRKPVLDSEQSDAEMGKKYHSKIQVLSKGTLLGHEMILSAHCTDVEKGALTVAVNEFASRKPFLGGHISKGLGKVHVNYPDLPEPAPYLNFINDNKAEIREYLHYLNKTVKV